MAGLGPSRARLKWRLSAPRHDQASLRRLARARAQRRPKLQCDFLSNQRVVHVYLWEGSGHAGLAAKMANVDFALHAHTRSRQ